MTQQRIGKAAYYALMVTGGILLGQSEFWTREDFSLVRTALYFLGLWVFAYLFLYRPQA
jgi:hypothetical protein